MRLYLLVFSVCCALVGSNTHAMQVADGEDGSTPVQSDKKPVVTPDHSDLPVYDPSHPSDLIEINAHVSGGISALNVNYGKTIPGLSDFLLSPGFQFKTGMDVSFLIRRSLSLSTGLDFGINNFRYAMSIIDNNTGSVSSLYVGNHFYDLTVPLYLTFRLNLGHRIQWHCDLGAYMAWGLGGQLKTSGYNTGENSLGQPIVTHMSYQTDYFNSSSPLVNGVKSTDYGPRLGIGLLYSQHFSIKLIGQMSICNLSKSTMLNVRYRNVSLAMQLGYSF